MLVRDIEKALLHAERHGFSFSAMTLSKSALVHLCRRLEPPEDGEEPLQIVEFGSGQSTIFWSALHTLGLLPIHVTSLEHDGSWAGKVRSYIDQAAVRIFEQTLRQISEEERTQMFAVPSQAGDRWRTKSQAVAKELYADYTIRNTFYGEADLIGFKPGSIDAVVLDGPHGNGRSMAFPLLAHALRPGSLILIDDFDHYPFLEDLGLLFRYTELYMERVTGKHWVLVRLESVVAHEGH